MHIISMIFAITVFAILATINTAAQVDQIHKDQLDSFLGSQRSHSKPVIKYSQLQKDHLRIDRLLQGQEGQEIDKQNQQAFKTLRQGLHTWPKKPTHLGKSPQAEMLQRLNAVQRARQQQVLQKKAKEYVAPLFEKQLLDKQDISQQIKVNEQAQTKKNSPKFSIQKMFYIVISIVIVYVFICVKRRCQDTTRVVVHNQEAETLNTL